MYWNPVVINMKQKLDFITWYQANIYVHDLSLESTEKQGWWDNRLRLLFGWLFDVLMVQYDYDWHYIVKFDAPIQDDILSVLRLS